MKQNVVNGVSPARKYSLWPLAWSAFRSHIQFESRPSATGFVSVSTAPWLVSVASRAVQSKSKRSKSRKCLLPGSPTLDSKP